MVLFERTKVIWFLEELRRIYSDLYDELDTPKNEDLYQAQILYLLDEQKIKTKAAELITVVKEIKSMKPYNSKK